MAGKMLGKYREKDPEILAARAARAKEVKKLYVTNNPERVKAIQKRHRAKQGKKQSPHCLGMTKRLRQLKSDTPCADCGGRFHFSAMDYDHVRGAKVMSVSSMAFLRMTWPQVLEEIAKCELVCSNCHRVRTWNRWQWARDEKARLREEYRAENPKYSRVAPPTLPVAFEGPTWEAAE